MKTCKNCGAQMAEQAKFCTICGTSAAEEQKAGQDQNSGADPSGYQSRGYQEQNYQNYPNYQNQAYPNQGGQNYGGYQDPGSQMYGGYPNQAYGNYGQPGITSGLAVASLVFGIVGIFLGYLGAALMVAALINPSWTILAILLYVPSALGVLLGIAGIAKTGDGRTKGRGLAIAGLVLGIVFLLVWVIMAVIARDSVDYVYNLYNMFR